MKVLYLSKEQLAALNSYTYRGSDLSFISKYVLQPYWTWLVTLFPMWMACVLLLPDRKLRVFTRALLNDHRVTLTVARPNLITLSGFMFVVANLATVLWYSPDMEEACPRWVYFWYGSETDPPCSFLQQGLLLRPSIIQGSMIVDSGFQLAHSGTFSLSRCALGLFIYQSFDAIDGKQARRTQSSSPLGELFDHCKQSGSLRRVTHCWDQISLTGDRFPDDHLSRLRCFEHQRWVHCHGSSHWHGSILDVCRFRVSWYDMSFRFHQTDYCYPFADTLFFFLAACAFSPRKLLLEHLGRISHRNSSPWLREWSGRGSAAFVRLLRYLWPIRYQSLHFSFSTLASTFFLIFSDQVAFLVLLDPPKVWNSGAGHSVFRCKTMAGHGFQTYRQMRSSCGRDPSFWWST
jgi:hypothetical protein